MDHALLAIKRLCLADRIAFTLKAREEMAMDGLTRGQVREAMLNADRIQRRLRSANPDTGRRETLYVINSCTWEGEKIYTKGKIAAVAGEDRFYVLISSKRSIEI